MRPEQLIEACKDPHWRLRHLYKIKDKNGQVVTFRPWPELILVLHRAARCDPLAAVQLRASYDAT